MAHNTGKTCILQCISVWSRWIRPAENFNLDAGCFVSYCVLCIDRTWSFRLDIHELSDKIKMLIKPLKCILIWCRTSLLKKPHEWKVDTWKWRDILFVQQNAKDFVSIVLLLVLFINEKKDKTIEQVKKTIFDLKAHWKRIIYG